MSKVEKDIKKFYRKPVPNDITYEEMERVAELYQFLFTERLLKRHILNS